MINRPKKLLQAKGNGARKSRATGRQTAIWRSVEDAYALAANEMAGTLAVRTSAPGLRDLSPACGHSRDCTFPVALAVREIVAAHGAVFHPQSERVDPECRIRGRSIDVQFDATRDNPVRMHLYWKATAAGDLDLEVLASSSSEIGCLEVLTETRLVNAEVLVRTAAAPHGWANVRDAQPFGDWIVFPRDRSAGRMALDGRPPNRAAIATDYQDPIVVYRPAHQDWSYVEMSRKEDCVRIAALATGSDASVSFGLFGLDIEKGVILRGRVRAMFLDRRTDLHDAADRYARFCTEAPRLSV